MKLTSKLSLALFLLAAPLGLRATIDEQAYLDQYVNRDRSLGPVPVAVYTPNVSNEFAGQHLVLEFIVDVHGRPHQFRSCTSGADPYLVETVEEAVRNWEFAPALRNGLPANRRVVLPVEIVAGDKYN
jgi:Gram-negative bacterial TonB protein C-terminal